MLTTDALTVLARLHLLPPVAAAAGGTKWPFRWTWMTASHSSSVMLTSPRSRRMPALFTSTSSPPNASTADVDERLAAGPVGDVVVRRHRLATRAADLFGGLLGPVAEVVDDDLGALGGEEQGVLAPDAPSGAGDDRDPTVESAHGGAPYWVIAYRGRPSCPRRTFLPASGSVRTVALRRTERVADHQPGGFDPLRRLLQRQAAYRRPPPPSSGPFDTTTLTSLSRGAVPELAGRRPHDLAGLDVVAELLHLLRLQLHGRQPRRWRPRTSCLRALWGSPAGRVPWR